MTVAGGTSPRVPLGPAALQPGNRIAPWGDRLREEADAPSLRRSIPCLAPKAPPRPRSGGGSGGRGCFRRGQPQSWSFPGPAGRAPLAALQAHREEGDSALGGGDCSSYLAFSARHQAGPSGSVLQKAVGRRDGVCGSKQPRQNGFVDF